MTGKLEDLGLRVLGRPLDCLPDGVGDLAAAAAAGVRRVRAIGADYADEVVVDTCLLYTSDAADERSSVDLGGRRTIKKKKKTKT